MKKFFILFLILGNILFASSFNLDKNEIYDLEHRVKIYDWFGNVGWRATKAKGNQAHLIGRKGYYKWSFECDYDDCHYAKVIAKGKNCYVYLSLERDKAYYGNYIFEIRARPEIVYAVHLAVAICAYEEGVRD